jgi:uncharacterized protein
MEQETQMKCPIDGEMLVIADRGGVEIDYCPKCRGVWLDRGELDKIIERSVQAAPPPPPPSRGQDYGQPPRRDDDYGSRDGYGGQPRKRRESFLGELFDF